MGNKVEISFTANIKRDNVAYLMKRYELEAVGVSIDDVWAKISEKPTINLDNLDYSAENSKEFSLVMHSTVISYILRELMKEGKGND